MKVYYNSACPVCRRGIDGQRQALEGCEIEWVDVHAQPERAAETGLELEDVRKELRIVDDKQQLHTGTDAFALLFKQRKRWRHLAWLLSNPRLQPAWHRTYSLFAERLYRWNRKKKHW